MKILKKGLEFSKTPWVGQKLKCPVCHCHFQLELEDGKKDNVHRDPNPNDGNHFVTYCPNKTCNSKIYFQLEKKRYVIFRG